MFLRIVLLAALACGLALAACSTKSSSASTGWGTGATIDISDAGSVIDVALVVDASDNVTAVWTQSGASVIDLWTCRRTPSGGWGTTRKLDTEDLGDVGTPGMVIDSSGNVTVVWRQSDGTRDNQWAAHYRIGLGWDGATKIETSDAGSVDNAVMAVTSGGRVIVAWRQSDGTRYNQWGNVYVPGSGWETAELLETEDFGSAFVASIVADGSASATLVWTQDDGARLNQWANRYASGSWGTAAKIETQDLGDANSAKLAVDSLGNVMAVWTQSDGTRNNQWANRYVPGTGWGTAAEIETEDLGSAQVAALSVGTDRRVMAVWIQSNGAVDNLWSNLYTPATGWGGATLVETDSAGSVLEYDVHSTTLEEFFAFWTQSDGTRVNLSANRHASGSWGTAATIENESAGDASFIAGAAIDSSQRLSIVFQMSDGTRRNQWANHFDEDGWGVPERIETEDLGDTRRAALVIDDDGTVTAVWRQSDGTRINQWANRYTYSAGWGEAYKIESSDAGDALPRQMVVDSRGRVTVVWAQSDGTRFKLWANTLGSR